MLCWEVFTCGMPPYSTMIPKEVISALNEGKRLEKPSNAVCSEEMYLIKRCIIILEILLNMSAAYVHHLVRGLYGDRQLVYRLIQCN